jgi:hypothetical protein
MSNLYFFGQLLGAIVAGSVWRHGGHLEEVHEVRVTPVR